MVGLYFLFLATIVVIGLVSVIADKSESCRFALSYECEDFSFPSKIDEYLSHVMKWEHNFAQPGVGYDPKSGYTYDGHPLNYTTGELYGDPHLFSAPSKESIHMAILALALDGNKHALEFAGGFDELMKLLDLKIKGYMQFNETFPGFGCFTPWVGFNLNAGTFAPLPSWSVPYYKVPGLDNGEWFWGLYAIADILKTKYALVYPELTQKYAAFVQCQKTNAKTIFYRGDGNVSATVYIKDAKVAPYPGNYMHCDGYLDDPYEGETMTQMLYLFSPWDSADERDLLWRRKRPMLQAVNYTIPEQFVEPHKSKVITVQRGFWFSTHEQWKALLLPYLSNELPLVKKIFRYAEIARVFDAFASENPGLMASINDVTDGSEDIPSYASACGIQSIAFEEIERRDLMTPYGAFGLFLQDKKVGLCWYNNMLRGPRMQSSFGSTEAINVNSTEISPLTTWDSKITTVLAMLGGIGPLTERGLRKEFDREFGNSFNRFVYILNREHSLVFGNEAQVLGGDIDFKLPKVSYNFDSLSDWDLSCA